MLYRWPPWQLAALVLAELVLGVLRMVSQGNGGPSLSLSYDGYTDSATLNYGELDIAPSRDDARVAAHGL